MKKILFFLCSITTLQFVQAQSDFRSGYIITLKSDTIKGLIDYREGTKNFEVCSFKKATDAEPINYKPFEVRGYGFNNDKYLVSKEFEIDQITNKAFFEVLVQGRVSLYKHRLVFYIQKTGSDLYELKIEKREVKNDEGNNAIKKIKHYLRVLSYLLSDCTEMRSQIYKTHLNEKSLIKLLKKYYSCVDSSFITFTDQKPLFLFSTGLFTGLNSSDLSFKPDIPGNEHLTSGFDRSNSLILGLAFDFLFPRLSEKLSFHSEVQYLSNKYVSDNFQDNGSTVVRNDISFELKNIKIPIGFQYTFRTKTISPYVSAGIAPIFYLNSSSNWIRETEFVTSKTILTRESEALPLNSSQFGVWGGIGLKRELFKKYKVHTEFRYEITNGIANSHLDTSTARLLALSSKISNIQLLIGITF